MVARNQSIESALVMRIPESPPDFSKLAKEIVKKSPERFTELVAKSFTPDFKGRYLHWDKLKYLNLPTGLNSHEEWWLVTKMARLSISTELAHKDKDGSPFSYCEPNSVRRLLHQIDIHGGGEIRASEQVANPVTRDMYLINSLIEESITSSQLEGAATTKKVAKEMIRQNRKPLDRSERMILNNYHAMEFIREIATEDLSPEIILRLHKILTEGTLDNPEAAGHLRTTDDISVWDERDTSIIHVPPKASELKKRMNGLCKFANDESAASFVHPVVKAIILHFLLAYDHPFEDGNGRTARALFYWMMLRQGYWTMEYISISRILKKAPAQYAKAFLQTETDSNDITYFIIHQLEVIQKAIQELLIYLEKKSRELKTLERMILNSPKLRKLLNHRQMAVLNRALKNPSALFYVHSHRGAHKISYDTARTDLLSLVDLGLLTKMKSGRAFVFMPDKRLKSKLKAI